LEFKSKENQNSEPELEKSAQMNRPTDQVIEIGASDFLKENIIDITASDLIYED